MESTVKSGDYFSLRFAWSPSTGLVRATYRVEVERYEPKGDRFQCRLLELVEVSGLPSHQETGIVPSHQKTGIVPSGSELTREMIESLVGQHALIPREGLNGLTLRLKMTTLTGGLKHPYFFNE